MGRSSTWGGVGTCAALLGALAVGACAAKGTTGFDADAATFTDAGVSDEGGGGGSDAGGSGFGDSGATPDAPVGGGETIFYAHDNRALYRVDAKDPTLAVSKLGDFDCIEGSGSPPAGKDTSMTDVAVDRAGKLYGVSPKMFFADITVVGGAAQCLGKGKNLSVAAGVRFFGASFAPVGTVDANAEAFVVGNTDGDLYTVDLATGQTTQLGSLGLVPANDGSGHSYPGGNVGKAWELSGDVVFLENGARPLGFATVRDCPNPPSATNCNTTDTLVEIDMTKLRRGNTASVVKAVRGQIVKAAGCGDTFNAGYGSMYGIAAFQGDIIGFSKDSFLVRIDNNRGGACLITDHKTAVPAGFSGAGVTTIAPVVEPPPR